MIYKRPKGYFRLLWKCIQVLIILNEEYQIWYQLGYQDIRFWQLLNRPIFNCIYHFPIDFEKNGFPFGSKSIQLMRLLWLLWEVDLSACSFTQGNVFEILLDRTGIGLYLPFSDWSGTKLTSVWFQIGRRVVNAIRVLFDFVCFRKDFSVYLIFIVSLSRLICIQTEFYLVSFAFDSLAFLLRN